MRMKYKMLILPAVLVLIFGYLVFTGTRAYAEIMPGSGTFEGIYHQDRWGVGHFSYLHVAPALHEKLAKYEGKRIRIKTPEIIQYENPGPGFIMKIDEITELPELPYKLQIRTIPEIPAPNEPFQLVCDVYNCTNETIVPSGGTPLFSVFKPWPVKNPNEPNMFFKDYTAGQLAVEENSFQIYPYFMSPGEIEGNRYVMGRITHQGPVSIPPGGFLPYVLILDNGLDAGEYEFSASARFVINKTSPEAKIWKKFDVKKDAPKNIKPEPRLAVADKSFEIKDEWCGMNIMLASAKGASCKVVRKKDRDRAASCGKLYGLDDNGNIIELVVKPDYKDCEREITEVSENGVLVRADFRAESRFYQGPIKKLVLSLLTDNGVEDVVLDNSFKDLLWVEPPPFGEESNGLKLRMRPAKKKFGAKDELFFYFQLANVSGKPAILQGPQVELEIDGVIHKIGNVTGNYGHGWAREYERYRPEEWTLKLPLGDTRSIGGAHTLKYTEISNAGFFTNANGKQIPLFVGRLSSSVIRFEFE
jgi:hypothetical protein